MSKECQYLKLFKTIDVLELINNKIHKVYPLKKLYILYNFFESNIDVLIK